MKALIVLPVLVGVVLLDVVTKAVAVSVLSPAGIPQAVVGDWVRFALVYNPGAAFGLHFGGASRWIFMALTVIALGVLGQLYRASAADDVRRLLALALVAAGAVGNVIDRIRSELGVVDFIDVGIGPHRWPTFNVADIAVSSGALLLAFVLWQEDRQAARLAVVESPDRSS